jgi:hypothetical protein
MYAGNARPEAPAREKRRLEQTAEPDTRKVGLILMIAIYLFPGLFWWFLLRRGYAKSTRIAAFVYLAVLFAIQSASAVWVRP